jgi:dGTPase
VRREWPDAARELGIHPEVVEAAALAHDLGHPPFGHIGEDTLHESVCERAGDDELTGYEGNAQSFRIVTKLARRDPEILGLNLTRATLNAILKYPWLRESTGEHNKKWNVYPTEEEDFRFARRRFTSKKPDDKSAEAQIMDWSDDIAYSVHDVEDFYRAGLTPIDRLIVDKDVQAEFLKRAAEPAKLTAEQAKEALDRSLEFVPQEIQIPYDGNFAQRGALRRWTSLFVGQYVSSVHCVQGEGGVWEVKMHDKHLHEIAILKQLTRNYVITTPSLAAQQHGQKGILRYLFDVFFDAASTEKNRRLLPLRFRQTIETEAPGTPSSAKNRLYARTAADVVSSMSEQEAIALYARLRGMNAGSVRDGIVF